MKKEALLLVFLVSLLFLINYNFLDKSIEGFFVSENSEYANVSRVIDGDTIEVNGNESVRLLGINTPERGEKYYAEAKEFLNSLVVNETIKLSFAGDRYDKYGRKLAYIFIGNKNVNVEIVEQGFANYYFYSGKDMYSKDLMDAWDKCISNKKNLCEPSINVCASCLEMNLDYITNTCSFSCDITNWVIKGEGREKFVFSKTLQAGKMTEFELDLTYSSGSLYLRDEEEKLVLWKE